METAVEHGVLHSHTAAHDDATAHDVSHDASAHDAAIAATATAAAVSVRRHDDSDPTIHGWPESEVQRNGGSARGVQLLKSRGG